MKKEDGYITLGVALLNLIAVLYIVSTKGDIILVFLLALNLITLSVLGTNIIDKDKTN